jgi:chromosome segregation ATPase
MPNDLEKDHLVHRIDELNLHVRNTEKRNHELSRNKAELVLKLSELEVELKGLCRQNSLELKERLARLDEARRCQEERLAARSSQESKLAIDLAATYEARKGVERLRQSVEDKQRKLKNIIVACAEEVKSLESNTFSLRMQLTEASRQKFRDVSNGLEAHTTSEMVSMCKEASIRNVVRLLTQYMCVHSTSTSCLCCSVPPLYMLFLLILRLSRRSYWITAKW